MASSQQFVDFVVEQLRAAGDISARKMFGEYGVYCDGKIVGLICDDQLFLKPTPAGRAYVGAADGGELGEGPAYPGGKPQLMIDDRLEDAEWLSGLIRAAMPELPTPKPKKPRAKRPGGKKTGAKKPRAEKPRSEKPRSKKPRSKKN